MLAVALWKQDKRHENSPSENRSGCKRRHATAVGPLVKHQAFRNDGETVILAVLWFKNKKNAKQHYKVLSV